MSIIKDYVSIDIETTGLDPKKDRIIEIGAVRVRDGNISEVEKKDFESDANEQYCYKKNKI